MVGTVGASCQAWPNVGGRGTMTPMSSDPGFAGVAEGRPFTVDDLEAMPDDGHRYELIDGVLIVTPAPGSAAGRPAPVTLLAGIKREDDLAGGFAVEHRRKAALCIGHRQLGADLRAQSRDVQEGQQVAQF